MSLIIDEIKIISICRNECLCCFRTAEYTYNCTYALGIQLERRGPVYRLADIPMIIIVKKKRGIRGEPLYVKSLGEDGSINLR